MSFRLARMPCMRILNVTSSGALSREYINFGRTGELLYMMLCRSSSAAQLRPHIANMMAGRNPWNAVLALFQPDAPEDSHTRGKSYLPYREHKQFDRLAEDWLRILELRLPGFRCHPPSGHTQRFSRSVIST